MLSSHTALSTITCVSIITQTSTHISLTFVKLDNNFKSTYICNTTWVIGIGIAGSYIRCKGEGGGGGEKDTLHIDGNLWIVGVDNTCFACIIDWDQIVL